MGFGAFESNSLEVPPCLPQAGLKLSQPACPAPGRYRACLPPEGHQSSLDRVLFLYHGKGVLTSPQKFLTKYFI